MPANVFAVKIIPYSINNRRDELSVSNKIRNEKACKILSKVYKNINEKFLISKNISLFANKLNDSYFCCCFDDGFSIFSFLADANAEKLELRGIYITDEYMRTVWKLYREKLFYLLYMNVSGETLLDPDYIMNEIYSIEQRLSVGTNERLKDIGKQLTTKDIPCNCAFAKFQLSYMPISFNNYQAADASAESAEKDGGIVIDNELKNSYLNRIADRYPKLSGMRLCCSSVKTYLSLKKEELKELPDKSEFKLQFKEEKEKVADYGQVWYFQYQLGGIERYSRLKQNDCLNFPIHYADVLDYFVSEYKHCSNAAKKNDVQMEEIGLNEKEREEPPKKRFPSLFRK